MIELPAELLANAAGWSTDHFHRVASEAGVPKRKSGKAYQLHYTSEILRAFSKARYRAKRQASEKLFSSAAAAGLSSEGERPSQQADERERGGAKPPISVRTGAAAVKSLIELSNKAGQVVTARACVLERLREFERHSGLSPSIASEKFAELCRSGEIELPAGIVKVSAPTLIRWAKLARNGIGALAPKHGNRAESGIIEI
ncbi:MAG TPA: hypothetical protein VKS22_04310 [Candidatus Binataceae bacterium]|nr:hypothetical protein [Candidatus Binataceae bacterium]